MWEIVLVHLELCMIAPAWCYRLTTSTYHQNLVGILGASGKD